MQSNVKVTRKQSQRQPATLFFFLCGALEARLTSCSRYSPLPPLPPTEPANSKSCHHNSSFSQSLEFTLGAGPPVRLAVEVVIINRGMDLLQFVR